MGTGRDMFVTLPQSRREEEVADAIFAFFLLFFSFSPACTTSLESVRQLGQYLGRQECHLQGAWCPSARWIVSFPQTLPTDRPETESTQPTWPFRTELMRAYVVK